jgi:hypothetical protein
LISLEREWLLDQGRERHRNPSVEEDGSVGTETRRRQMIMASIVTYDS